MQELRKWIKNAQLTQRAFAIEFEIPLRTVEDWLGERRKAPDYVIKLIVEKLKTITSNKIENKMIKEANRLKADENGNRPVGKWVLLEHAKTEIFVEFHNSMKEAIDAYDKEVNYYKNNRDVYEVGYILCNKNENGSLEPWYVDKEGNTYGDYETIDL